MEQWLAGKRLVVMGGTSGIGFSAVQSFVEHGARVVLVGLDEEGCTNAKSVLGDDTFVLLGDAREKETSVTAIKKCRELYGGFDGLYHVAGGSGRKFGDGPLHELTKEAWEQTFDLNLTSMMWSNQAAVRAWLDGGEGGTILNIASVLGLSPSPVYFSTHAYAAAKAAVFGFTKSVASYYASSNIRVNALAPGLIATPMSARASTDANIQAFIQSKQPLEGGRMGRASDLDGAALYFLSDFSRFTTGQTLSVDGGWSVSEGQIVH
jgi:NAD(P)-dependent dehydrogenase (short-subunit alcohol dehydrogenase family)